MKIGLPKMVFNVLMWAVRTIASIVIGYAVAFTCLSVYQFVFSAEASQSRFHWLAGAMFATIFISWEHAARKADKQMDGGK